MQLGRIVGLFGVKGWVKVFSYTDPRQAILDYTTWWLNLDGERRPVRIAEGKRHGKSVIARIEGTEDCDQAAKLIDADISVPRSELPDVEDGQYYWADLEGLSVVTENGDVLGDVAYVLETGANDVLVVRGEKERLIPFVTGDVVTNVDLVEGVLTVDWEWD